MTVTLYFEFESPDSIKEPVILSADVGALIPWPETSWKTTLALATVADYIFDGEAASPSITLECVPGAAGPPSSNSLCPLCSCRSRSRCGARFDPWQLSHFRTSFLRAVR